MNKLINSKHFRIAVWKMFGGSNWRFVISYCCPQYRSFVRTIIWPIVCVLCNFNVVAGMYEIRSECSTL